MGVLFALLFLAQPAITTAEEYKFATLQAAAESVLSNETGVTLLGARALDTVQSYTSPTVVIAESGLLLMELSNLVLAGREFANKPAVPGLGTIRYHVFATDTTADVILRVNGVVERTLTVPALTTDTLGGSWLEQDVEIVSTADVLVIVYQAPTVTLNKPFMPVPPVTRTIYGQCSSSCRIQIWGGDTTVPIQRTCTDGSSATVTAGAFTGTTGYNGVTCKWTAPDGYRISGAAHSDGTGREPDVAAFVPSEYFQLVTPVPTYMAFLLLISWGPAQCTYGGETVTLTGASGVYHARLTAVDAATVVECNTPVTAVGDASCVVSSCTGREMNLIVGPLGMLTGTTTTTTSSSATGTTSTNSSTATSLTSTSTSSSSSSSSSSNTTTSTMTTSSATTSSSTTSMSTTETNTTTSATATTSTNTSTDTQTTLSATNTTGTATWTTLSATWTTLSATNTTTTTSTPALADRVEAVEASVFAALVGGDNSTVTERVNGITVLAAKLDAAAVAAAGGSLTVRLDETQAAVTVPESLFSSLNLGVDGVVLTVASVDIALMEGFMDIGSTSEVEMAAIVNANLFTLSGRRLNVSGLEEPITVSLPVNHTGGLQCVFWDEGTSEWTGTGLEFGGVKEGILQCRSTHMTFFAAIFRGFLNTLVCSQVTLLNAGALQEMGKGHWYRTTGALVFWSLLAIFMLLLLLAARLDRRRQRQGKPHGEHLLIPLQTPGADARHEEGSTDGDASGGRHGDGDASDGDGSGGRRGYCAACCAAIGCAWLLDWCRSSGAVRDVLDEIFARWLEHFGEIRDFLEGLTEGLTCSHDHGSSAGARMAVMAHQFMNMTLLISAKRQAAASLGISWDISCLLMENSEALAVVRAYRTSGGGSRWAGRAQLRRGVSRITLAREEAWGQLHRDMDAKLESVMEASAYWSSLPRTVWRLFLHQNPFGMCLVHCALTSCKMRVLLLMVDIVGSVMLATVFYSAAGIPKKRNQGVDCDVESPWAFVGQILAIGTGSLIVAGIPATLLGSLCTRHLKKFDYEGCPKWNKQLKIWRRQDRAIWVLGVLYLTFCVFFVSLFLANVDQKDHAGWLISAGLSIVENTVIIPLVVALVLCFLVTACLSIESYRRKVTKEELVSELHQKFKSKVGMSVSVGRI